MMTAVFRLTAAVYFVCCAAGFGADHQFRFEKPDAQSVDLMAEFNGWKAQPMQKQTDGTWTITVSISPGTYGYKFLVNGSDWVFDPNNPGRKTINGIENSVVEIADTGNSPGRAAPVRNATPIDVASPSPVGQAPTSQTAGLTSVPGAISNLQVPLSPKRRNDALKEGNTRLLNAKMAIAVPSGFDPQKSWPILIINNTLSFPNIDSMNQFKDAAMDEGWVIMAADAPESEKDEKAGWRWPTIAAAMDYVTETWPGAKDWPIACGGMSGGGKNSTFIAAAFAREHRRLIGMLMMGCNQDMASVAFHRSAPPGFLCIPIFLSSGKSDTIATPAQHEAVRNSMHSTGFSKVRLESFDGAHDVYQPHVHEALKWFAAESIKNSPSQRADSDFDKFFKKKP